MNFKFFRKIFFILCISFMFLSTGCVNNNADMSDTGKLSIVCTTFPQYDWVRNIAGENTGIEISLIINDGTEPHSYQASADDIIKINKSDIFIFNGGQSDSSFKKIAEQNTREEWVVINMMEALSDKLLNEEVYEIEEHHNAHQWAYDEHIWLSLKNTIELCRIITDELSRIDFENSKVYKENCEKYIASLTDLDLRFENLASEANIKEIILVDRYPFKYLMNDYNLICYAAFPGCSSDTDASFDTVVTLANKVDELNVSKVAVTENSTSSIADAVISASDAETLEVIPMNSLQSVSQKDIDAGLTYLSVMEQNYESLNRLLNDTHYSEGV